MCGKEVLTQRAGEAPEPKWVQESPQRAAAQWAPPRPPNPWTHPGPLGGWALCLTCVSSMGWRGAGDAVAFYFIISFSNKRTCLAQGSVLLLSPVVMGGQFHAPGPQEGDARLPTYFTLRRRG